MMVPTRNLRFFSTVTRSMGLSSLVWRMKNQTTPTMPMATVAMDAGVAPEDPNALNP